MRVKTFFLTLLFLSHFGCAGSTSNLDFFAKREFLSLKNETTRAITNGSDKVIYEILVNANKRGDIRNPFPVTVANTGCFVSTDEKVFISDAHGNILIFQQGEGELLVKLTEEEKILWAKIIETR